MANDPFGTKKRHPFRILLIILGAVLLAFVALGFFRAGGAPEIRIEPELPVIGKKTPVKIQLSEPRRGLTTVTVELIQGDKVVKLEEKSYVFASQYEFWGDKTESDILLLEVGKQTVPGLTGETAAIRVTAGRAGTWLRNPAPKVEELVLPVRLVPPTLQVVSTQTYVAQGGCEVVVYRVGDTAVRDGVRAGSWWFPGYPLPGGGKQDRFAFFAVPYDMNQPDVRLIAEDAAGNAAERGFIDQFFAKSFRSDTITVSDTFMGKVVPEILSQTPEFADRGDLLQNYLAINRELRAANAEVIVSLARKSQPAFLWNKPFYRMPNGKPMAAFADRRSYEYQGKIIDNQTHLGFDLAVTKQYPVPAANSGVVVHAKYFGIYGNTVILDHGYGLQTIYSHLSSIDVAEGQKISRGDIIGKTGETGLAGGDHLHFCTILHGLPVNPAEWWDGHWIKDRIARKLGPAFAFSE